MHTAYFSCVLLFIQSIIMQYIMSSSYICHHYIDFFYMFLCVFLQYGVQVTKFDRRGYKPRPRQLLLTSNSAVIVEDGKLKQRIDYNKLQCKQTSDGW